MQATSSIERELKLSAPAGFRLPDLHDVAPGLSVGEARVERSEATYYDTQDLRLARWGAGLRFRTVDGWTAKLPAPGSGSALVRREYRFAGSPDRCPAGAEDLVLAVTRGAALGPVVRLRTVRRRVDVADASGAPLAEVTDDRVAVLDGDRVVQRFREVEVELAPGCAPEIVDSIVARLRRAGAGPAHRISKHLRALGLEPDADAEVEVPEVGPHDGAFLLLRRALARSVRSLVERDAGVRVDEAPEDVHQMRVATRRLRSLLGSYGPLFDAEWARGLSEELRWLGQRLGAVRDADVLALRLRDAAAQLDPRDEQAAKDVLDRLAEARRAALGVLLETLRSAHYLGLVDRLVDAARAPRLASRAEGPAARVVAPLVQRAWKRLRRARRKLDDPPSPAGLHAVRIRAKHARYAAEVAAPVFGKPARQFARALHGVQQVLGEHQDAVVAGAWLREAAAQVPRESAYAAGLLASLEEALAAAALEEWPAAWKKAADRRLRGWLREALAKR